uniref:phosphoenolpyruvate--protein phosphotransferase n=1 Tax=uncultured Ruthenibacterium sp. TaxID=1905347 RepID=UPI00349E82C8
RTSHSAILARTLGIPAVLGIVDLMSKVHEGDQVLVNGGTGEVILSPSPAQTEAYRIQRAEILKEQQILAQYRDRPTVDADGRRYALYANIGSPEQASQARSGGAEGIGLFRTEFLFMERATAPDENEQYRAYQAVSDAMSDREILIRTLDIGGDKNIPYLAMEREENPFLGYRAIRYCLDRPDFFSVQLRALLRAGAKNRNIRIMLPLVTGVEEVRATRQLVEKCKEELEKRGELFDPSIQIGVMIETPAAVQIADLLAREADFFSIGTNDLTQYTLAVDRGNAKVENMYRLFHPAVLRAIRQVVNAAKQAHIPVGMCGEAAADPRLIPLLMAWGLDEFSVSTPSILAVRHRISQWSQEHAVRLAEKVMNLSSIQEIETELEKE